MLVLVYALLLVAGACAQDFVEVESRGDLSCSQVLTGETADWTDDAYFRFVAPYSGKYVFSSCGSAYDTVVSVWRADSRWRRYRLAAVRTCDDCLPLSCGRQAAFAVDLSAGRYLVEVDGHLFAAGQYRLSSVCPDLNSTYEFNGELQCGSSITGDTRNSTSWIGDSAPDHHWNFTAPFDGIFNFDTCGSTYDTFVRIYKDAGGVLGNLVASCDGCGTCGSSATHANLTVHLNATQKYIVVVDGVGSSDGIYVMNVSCTVPPVSTFFEGTLSCGATVSGDTSEGTSDIGTAAPDHYWRFDTATGGYFTFSSCGSSYDTYIWIYSYLGDEQLGPRRFECDDCGYCPIDTRASASLLLEPGSYVIVMDGYESSSGRYSLTTFCGGLTGPAQLPLECGQTVTGSTANASSHVGEESPDIHYNFTAPVNGTYYFNTCESSFDTIIRVYSQNSTTSIGDSIGSCDDCGPCGKQAAYAVALTEGLYTVVIEGYGSEIGNYTLEVSCPCITCSPQYQGNLSCGETVSGNTSGATSFTGVPFGAGDHQWLFSVDTPGNYSFWSCGSSFDTFLFLYQITAEGRLGAPVTECDDCGTCGVQTQLTAELPVGLYGISLDGYGTEEGQYQLQTYCPPSDDLSITCGQVLTDTTVLRPSTPRTSSAPDARVAFTAPVGAYYNFDTCGSAFDTIVYVFKRGADGSVGDYVGECDDCGPCGQQASLRLFLPAGDYYVIVDGYDSAFGDFVLNATCGDALMIPFEDRIDCGQIASGTTVNATSWFKSQSAGDHSWLFQANETANYTFSTCGSSFDTFIHVFKVLPDGTAVEDISSCDDCGDCGTQAVLFIQLDPGYYAIGVDGYTTEEGEYSLSVGCPRPPALPYDGAISCGASVQGFTAPGGTSQVGDRAPDRHYTFEIAEDTIVTFNSCDSTFDTHLRIFERDGPVRLGETASCDDCGDCGTKTILETYLAPGSYILSVDGYGDETGNFSVTMSCENATVSGVLGNLTCGQFVSGNTTGFVSVVGGDGAGDHMYTFTPDVTGQYSFSTCASAFDTILYVFEMSGDGSLGRQVSTCDDCVCGDRTYLTTDLTAGVTYVVVVDGYGDGSGLYTLETFCPDSTRNYTIVASLYCGMEITGDTKGGISHVGQDSPDVHYSFSVPADGDYTFSTCGSSFDTFVHLYQANGSELGAFITSCDDCGDCGTRTVLTSTLAAGQNIIVVVDGYSTEQGAFIMSTTCPGGITPTSSPTMPPTASAAPTMKPTAMPSVTPSMAPTMSDEPSPAPTTMPSMAPTMSDMPTTAPTMMPSMAPTMSDMPTTAPTMMPTNSPTRSDMPTDVPTVMPTNFPTRSDMPTDVPTMMPTDIPTTTPSMSPTSSPTFMPSQQPIVGTRAPTTATPSVMPSDMPTDMPTDMPSNMPSDMPTDVPGSPSSLQTSTPTVTITQAPSRGGVSSGTTSPTSLTMAPTMSPTNANPQGSSGNKSSSSSSNTPLIAGVVVGVLLMILIVFVIFVFFIKKKGGDEEFGGRDAFSNPVYGEVPTSRLSDAGGHGDAGPYASVDFGEGGYSDVSPQVLGDDLDGTGYSGYDDADTATFDYNDDAYAGNSTGYMELGDMDEGEV